jgi:hypothetical protein
MRFWGLLFVVLLAVIVTPKAHSQLVTIPIPGSPLSLNVMANPQPLQNIYNNPAAVPYQLWDDGWANVPLPFTFPFFDKTFNNSTMYSNGAVQFGPPVIGFPSNNTFCCSGITIDRNTPSAYNYSILMMQDDLYGSTGNNHYSLGTSNTMTYGWYNVERLGRPENKTSFELKIDSSGGIDMRWTGALVSWSSPAIGVIGDASKGEFAVLQQGGMSSNTFSIPGLTQWTTGQTPDIVINPCTTNPLYAPSCPGYQAAYTEQQCSINPLYSTTCSGYQPAYTQQQCSINPLYSMTCLGYQAAYHSQQCSLNPLYSTDCLGYASAYLNQQCSLNALYSTTCSGYAEAFKAQQCTANQLYATDCPGYAQAYFNQQCSLNGLYDRTCSNYSTAYATAEALKQSTPAATTTTNTSAATTTVSATPTVDSSGEIKVAVVADSNVNTIITTTATSASPAAAATATVPLVAAAPAPTAPVVEAKVEAKQEAKSEDKKNESNSTTTANTTTSSSDPKSTDNKPTARQEIQAKRQEAARAKAVESGKQLANEMGKSADMESQKAVQNVVIQAMGFTPGFDAYQVRMPDVVGYKPYTVYNNQKNIDSRANLRMFGGTDALHNEMVNLQYK